jgi:hypothetical protein
MTRLLHVGTVFCIWEHSAEVGKAVEKDHKAAEAGRGVGLPGEDDQCQLSSNTPTPTSLSCLLATVPRQNHTLGPQNSGLCALVFQDSDEDEDEEDHEE